MVIGLVPGAHPGQAGMGKAIKAGAAKDSKVGITIHLHRPGEATLLEAPPYLNCQACRVPTFATVVEAPPTGTANVLYPITLRPGI